MKNYYTNYVKNRYSYYLNDLGLDSNPTLSQLSDAIYKIMTGFIENLDKNILGVELSGLLARKASGATEEIKKATCNAFANYLYTEIH